MTHDARLEQLLETMLGIARQDFDVKAPVRDDGTVIDAIAVGLNMLAEELRGEVASRRDLERAHEELQHTQAQLVHAGKLAAIGQLAAGVAHEINNPIQGVQFCLSILQRAHAQMLEGLAAGTLAQVRAHLTSSDVAIRDAQEAIERVRGVTSALQTFARVDDEAFTSVNLAEVVRVACRLGESTVRSRATLELDLPPVPLVKGSRGKLGQVVTNLLVNASQAVPEGTPERQTIRLSLSSMGGQVTFAVDDSGPGVPTGDRRRIFEPFFTTKPAELGMGLGLSLVAEIVKAHGGTIAVSDSTLGGARFEVVLPATTEDSVEPSSAVPSFGVPRPRVLLIDDEDVVLRVLEALLIDDCEVVTARSGQEALGVLGDDSRFDLVVCDLQMAGIDGPKVYETAVARTPALAARFVFVTGGAITARCRTFLDETRVRVLHKPFRIDTLLDLLRV
jgi:signal transduction histidine kinase/CheY-like chemotaxis protein